MDVINYLKAVDYDYLPCAKGDGVTDDKWVIQQRLYAGLECLKSTVGSCYLLNKPVVLRDKQSLKVNK